MKLSTKILALVLAALLAFGALVGCNNTASENNVPSDTVDNGNENRDDPPANDVVIPESDIITIDASNISEYNIVISESASALIIEEVTDFVNFFSATFETTVGYVNDSVPASGKEIVIGLTSRDASVALTESLSNEEYGIVEKDGSIYVVGYNDYYVELALGLLVGEYFDSLEKVISVYKNEENYVSPDFIKDVRIDGVSLKEYKIIIPENADILTQYAAENFKNYFTENSGFIISMATDATPESRYEILVGDTNRTADDNNITAKDGEYVLYKNGDKIVCQGENIWIGASVGAIICRFPSEGNGLIININDIPTEPCAKEFKFKEAKNAILLIGDGMGFNTVEMYKADKKAEFWAEYMINKGEAYTGSLNTKKDPTDPTDSAAGGTALSSGYKTVDGYLGVTEEKNALPNVRELAHMTGAKTAVLTTDKITGATPSAFLIHHDNRNDTSIIQSRITELINNKGVTIAVGDLGDGLYKRTVNTLKNISKDNSSFFMMLEEGHIDKRSHALDRAGCNDMTERFNSVIAYVIEFTFCHPDTVLIVTADHETGDIKKTANGDFKYTPLPNNPAKAEHSTQNVPVYALGYGTEIFKDKEVDNTAIPKFIAKIYGAVNFGV